MALVVTVGGETSDSYVSVSEADKYFQSHYSLTKAALWAALSQPRKESALKRACQQIETLKMLDNENLYGSLPLELVLNRVYDITIHRLENNQRLQIPRNIDINSSGVGFIPQEVKDAQCEQAVHMLAFDDTNLSALQQGIVIEAVSAGPVKSFVKYSEGHAPTYLAPIVVELLRPFFRRATQVRRG
jgi:hypothetical protein